MSAKAGLYSSLLVFVLLLAGCVSVDKRYDCTQGAPFFFEQAVATEEVSEIRIDTVAVVSDEESAGLELALEDALLLALENNRALRIERYKPAIRQASEKIAAAAFDPVLSADLVSRRSQADLHDESGVSKENRDEIQIGAEWRTPVGTRFESGVEAGRLERSGVDERYSGRVGAGVVQPLGRGAGRPANLAALRQARIDTDLSVYELKALAESIVERVIAAYLDCVLAVRQLEIVQASLELAERQLEETRQRVRVGGLPATELAAARAEVAMRHEALINARSRKDILHVRLVRLVRPQRLEMTDHAVSVVWDDFINEDLQEELSSHLAHAFANRNDLKQAHLLIQRGELELIRTANGLLPRMELFARIGSSGYADTLGKVFSDIGGDSYDMAFGVGWELPVGNRDARARHRSAELTLEQVDESLRNVEDLVREDVHTAWLEVNRARQQVMATAATRELQEEKLRAENVKYAAGQSTALFVAQAQRDLLAAQVAEVEAAIHFRKALAALYRMDGSILARNGIVAGF